MLRLRKTPEKPPTSFPELPKAPEEPPTSFLELPRLPGELVNSSEESTNSLGDSRSLRSELGGRTADFC